MRYFFVILTLLAAPTFAFACSLTVGGSAPSCPKGQRFDTAAACKCVPEKIILDRQRMAQPTTQTPPVPRIDPWYQCEKDADCIVTADACGRPASVNRQFKQPFDEKAQHDRPMVDCPTLEARPKPIAVCSTTKSCDLAYPIIKN